MRYTLTICALLGLSLAAGCGVKTTTSSDGKTTTVQTNGGTVSVGANAIDPGKLGAPVYPGATQDDGGTGMSLTTSDGTTSTAILKSADAFEKVYAFYKAQLPAGSEKMKISSGGESLATFQVGDSNSKESTTVTVSAKDGEPSTNITINHTTKSDSAMASAEPAASPAPSASAGD